MPPAAPSVFKQSRHKMHAFVTSRADSDADQNQPGVASSAPATAYDSSQPEQIHSQQPQTQPQIQPRNQLQTTTQVGQTRPQTQQVQLRPRHVNISPAKPSTTTTTTTLQPASQASPRRSRSPLPRMGAERAASVAAARVVVPPRSTHYAHARDASANLPSSQTMVAEPLPSQQSKAFWDASTAEGSFSDTASNMDSNTPLGYHQAPAQVHLQRQLVPAHQPRESPQRRPVPIHPDRTYSPAPFSILPNGHFDLGVGTIGTALPRSASTPVPGSPQVGFRNANFDNEHGKYASANPYDASPDRTPSMKRPQHPKPLASRQTRKESISNAVSRSKSDPAALPQSFKQPIYLDPSRNGPAEVPRSQSERVPKPQVSKRQLQQSNDVDETDPPTASEGVESDNASAEQEAEPMPTPKPASKPPPKAKIQVSRKLFIGYDKAKPGLRESAIPRSALEKRQPTTKKRAYELDYDDGALATMDYNALKDEAFDFDPAQAEAQSAFEPPRGTLSEKLEYFFKKDQVNQESFFAKMPVQDWEESGDWFLDKFGEVMNRFKEARREKRNIVNAFENEITEREQDVRNRMQKIGQNLTDLKTHGEGMVLDKGFK
ncbi:extracellular mutant protein 11-domain-containing protein [Astrocystis sublimbata]|nr:extracellular mutant protein 11-domain-containing protein [Astrocystis sublimbata]